MITNLEGHKSNGKSKPGILIRILFADTRRSRGRRFQEIGRASNRIYENPRAKVSRPKRAKLSNHRWFVSAVPPVACCTGKNREIRFEGAWPSGGAANQRSAALFQSPRQAVSGPAVASATLPSPAELQIGSWGAPTGSQNQPVAEELQNGGPQAVTVKLPASPVCYFCNKFRRRLNAPRKAPRKVR